MTGELFSVKGKVALVTGGSRGLGLAIAHGLVEAGAKVYISSRSAEACAEAAADLSKVGTCIALPNNLGTMEGIRAVSAELKAREPKLHLLVNNAGAGWMQEFEDYPEKGWDRDMNLNIKGPFFLIQALLPLLRAAASDEDPARVLNIGSIDGLMAADTQTFAYGASKAALHHLTKHLAKHLAKDLINVNAIAPGPFETKINAELFRQGGKTIAKSIPRGRAGVGEDLVGATLFYCSKASSYITGTVLPVDGGVTGTVYGGGLGSHDE